MKQAFFIEGLLQTPQNGEVKALSVSVPWLDVWRWGELNPRPKK